MTSTRCRRSMIGRRAPADHLSKRSGEAFRRHRSRRSSATRDSTPSSMIRLGAVSYLNTGPLVYGLDEQPERFHIRFDVPSQCAALLHENRVDLGLIPSIEYLRGPAYRIVPGVAIASDGPVASVALFSRKSSSDVRSIALDNGSRTSVALLKVLCARWFEISPAFMTMAPDVPAMLDACDAALVIGDNALFA